MANMGYSTKRVPVSFKRLGGGLNTTSGPLGLLEEEASDLQNIDFDKFGSILQRNGYYYLNSTAIGAVKSDGLYWFEYDSAGTKIRKAIEVCNGKINKMDDLDGTWDDITGALTVTSGNFHSFDSFLNTLLATNNNNVPWQWTGAGNASAMTVPAGLTKAKFVSHFQNYAILANVTVGGVYYPSRWYWSALRDITTWSATSWIEVSKDDGQDITGVKVLGDRLVFFKERSIHIAMFTGDRDVPFTMVKTNSPVGCVAPWSIQEIENGLIFLAYDGLYYFDGNNSYKVSYRLDKTFTALNKSKITEAVSLYQRNKNRYWLSTADSGSSTNDKVIVWDSYNNAFSIYDNLNASALSIFMVDGVDERPYFADYKGYTYRADNSSYSDDYPEKVRTAIDSYYYTNWKNFDDLVDQKGIPHIYLYHQFTSATLTLSYAYDFNTGNQRNISVDLSTSGALWDAFVWDIDVWASTGGNVQRKDFTGRGRVIRIGFSNNLLGETWQVDGFGVLGGLETNF